MQWSSPTMLTRWKKGLVGASLFGMLASFAGATAGTAAAPEDTPAVAMDAPLRSEPWPIPTPFPGSDPQPDPDMPPDINDLPRPRPNPFPDPEPWPVPGTPPRFTYYRCFAHPAGGGEDVPGPLNADLVTAIALAEDLCQEIFGVPCTMTRCDKVSH